MEWSGSNDQFPGAVYVPLDPSKTTFQLDLSLVCTEGKPMLEQPCSQHQTRSIASALKLAQQQTRRTTIIIIANQNQARCTSANRSKLIKMIHRRAMVALAKHYQ
eukprot:scpid83471/ scgid9553/ 